MQKSIILGLLLFASLSFADEQVPIGDFLSMNFGGTANGHGMITDMPTHFLNIRYESGNIYTSYSMDIYRQNSAIWATPTTITKQAATKSFKTDFALLNQCLQERGFEECYMLFFTATERTQYAHQNITSVAMQKSEWVRYNRAIMGQLQTRITTAMGYESQLRELADRLARD